jgi:hypothetical protein
MTGFKMQRLDAATLLGGASQVRLRFSKPRWQIR